MVNNFSRTDIKKSRAIVIRCSDQTFIQILDLIRSLPDCYLVYSKSSNLKLIVKEEGF